MAVVALLTKDMREHGMAAILLLLGCAAVVGLSLLQNRLAAFSMSPFEVVRFALLSVVPLVALITGNRLIVREYLSGTRLFVEALPVGSGLPLILKYLIGLVYLLLLAAGIVLLAARLAGIADDANLAYGLLILGKTAVVVCLYWSVVFCFSLCGHLRIALYVLATALIMLLAYFPGLDASRFPPFALLDDQLFVFERDIIPWWPIAGSLLIAAIFTIAGFVLATVGEGSVAARLAKPMQRRDLVALGVLGTAGLAVWSTLIERQQREKFEFTNDAVVRIEDPRISVQYLDPTYRSSAETIADRIAQQLVPLQAELGLTQLPTVRLSLTPGREKHEIDYSTLDGVFVSSNWLQHDSYDDAILDSVVLHGLLSAQTNGRAVFEFYHWVLDGFTRWWVEQGQAAINPQHRHELLARAVWALREDPNAAWLVHRWQLTADRFAYPTAEALAWAAMSYLEESSGRDTVIDIARHFLSRQIDNSWPAAISDRRLSSVQRFETLTGLDWQEFTKSWQAWLIEQADNSAVQSLLNDIPPLDGVVSVNNDAGYHELLAGYEVKDDVADSVLAAGSSTGTTSCVLKHSYLGPFDEEFDVREDDQDEMPCSTESTHRIDSRYAPGDRVFVALDYEGGRFHQPVRLHAERLSFP